MRCRARPEYCGHVSDDAQADVHVFDTQALLIYRKALLGFSKGTTRQHTNANQMISLYLTTFSVTARKGLLPLSGNFVGQM